MLERSSGIVSIDSGPKVTLINAAEDKCLLDSGFPQQPEVDQSARCISGSLAEEVASGMANRHGKFPGLVEAVI